MHGVCGVHCLVNARTIDSSIKNLRAKLNEFDHPGWDVKTSWGIGYRFETTEESGPLKQ